MSEDKICVSMAKVGGRVDSGEVCGPCSLVLRLVMGLAKVLGKALH